MRNFSSIIFTSFNSANGYAYNVTHANISSYFFYILYFLNGIRRLINN